MIRSFALLAFAFLAGIAHASQGTAQPSIAVSKTPLSLPFIVAREKGFFESQGLRPTITECVGGLRCLKLMLNGESQYATCSELPIVFESFERNNMAVLASFVSNTKDMKLLIQSDLMPNFPESLKGVKIGIVARSASQYYLDLVLSLYGINAESVQTVSLAPEKLTSALVNGEVQGISAWEPFGYKAKAALGDKAKAVDDLSIFNQSFNLVTNKNHLEKYPEEPQKILLALAQANEFIKTNPTEAKEILRKWLNLTKEFVDYSFPDHNYRLTISQSMVTSMLSQRQWAQSFVNAPQSDSFSIFDLIDARSLKAIRPLQVDIPGG